MVALYIAAAGTVFFLILTILSFVNKRFGAFASTSKFPLFILPLIAFVWILSAYLYIPFKGNGCSYSERQDFIKPEDFSVSKKSGILLLPINGFGDCKVTIIMSSGKTYSAESFNNIFAIVLPADSGKVSEILLGDNVSRISSGMKFVINPGKLTYIGSINNPKGLLGLLLPEMACKTANLTYETFSDGLRLLLENWARANRLVLTSSINDRLAELQSNYKNACQLVGIQFGYIPFTCKSLNGITQTLTPEEVVKQYKMYAFLVQLLGSAKSK
jgi:hypothetical protein